MMSLPFQVWMEAAEQSLRSLSLGQGALLVLSSFNDFRNRTPRDVIAVSLIDLTTCVLGSAAVHAMVGHLALLLAVPVDAALPPIRGLGIAFVAVPEALVRMAHPIMWSAGFFLSLYLLGLTASVSTFFI